MESEYLEEYFSWLPVRNTVEDRLKEDSLIHTFSSKNKIFESTKKLNKHLKKHRIKTYNSFIQCKQKISSTITKNLAVTDESDLSDSDYKIFYSSFNVTSTKDLKNEVCDDLFVWSFVEKKNLNTSLHRDQKSSCELTADLNVIESDSQALDKNESKNVNFKAAGALPIKKNLHCKKFQSNSKNLLSKIQFKVIQNNDNINIQTNSKHKPSDLKLLRNKKPIDVKRNLESAIDNMDSQLLKPSEIDLSLDFIPGDFQAQSTQIFSDTLTETNTQKNSKTKKVSKFSSNDAINQPRDSGIEEDSREENVKDVNTGDENRENKKENNLLKESDEKSSNNMKVLSKSKYKDQASLSSKNLEKSTVQQKKQSLKIIEDKTLTKKYKIIAMNNRDLQSIVEEKQESPLVSIDKSSNYSKHDFDNGSESDFESIKSEIGKEYGDDGEIAKTSSDEYFDSQDYENAIGLEDEEVSESGKSSVKNASVETDRDSDSQDSGHDHKKMKKFKERTSPWILKQCNELKRLRLLKGSECDSEIDLNENRDNPTISTKQQFSKKNEHTSKRFNNNANVKHDNKREKEQSVKNDDHSNSKSDKDDRECFECNATDNYKSKQKSNKVKQKKKIKNTDGNDLVRNTEQSCKIESHHNLTGAIKHSENAHLPQSMDDIDGEEQIYQKYKEDNASTEKSNFVTQDNLEYSEDESEEIHDVSPNIHAQKKIHHIKNLDLAGSYDPTDDSEIENDSINIKHEFQQIKTEISKEQICNGKYKTSSGEETEEEDEIPENEKRHLQLMKKMNLTAADESEDSNKDVDIIDLKNKSTILESKHLEDSVKKKMENSESSSDEKELILKSTSAKIPLQVSNRKYKASSGEETEEEEMPENEKRHLQSMRRMDLTAFDESEDSDEKVDVIDLKSKLKISESKHLEDSVKKKMENSESSSDEGEHILKDTGVTISKEEKKCLNSENENNKPKDHGIHLQEKVKSNQKSKCTNTDEDSDSKSNKYDSDNIDIEEHKVFQPDDLKDLKLLENLNKNVLDHFNSSKDNDRKETFFHGRNKDILENNEDEIIDNIIPSKRLQLLKRLNLYEDSESSDSDQSFKNDKNNKTISSNSSNFLKAESNDDSTNEKKSSDEEILFPINTSRKSKLNESKEECSNIDDTIVDEKELNKVHDQRNKNIIIAETQENEDPESNNIESQEMFSSLENLAEISQIPPTPESVPKQTMCVKPDRKKITRIAELVQQEELTEQFFEPTTTLSDILDEEELFVLDVPKSVFDKNVVGKKLAFSKTTLTIGDSNYEAFQKGASPILSCVLKSKKNKFKTVNVRPFISIVARRKKNAEDYENTESEEGYEKFKNRKSQRFKKEMSQELIDEIYDIKPTSSKKLNQKKQKLIQKDKLHGLSFRTSKENKITKKSSAKNDKFNMNNFVLKKKVREETVKHEGAKSGKILKRKLYASDTEAIDVIDSNATDDSRNSNRSLKKFKKEENVADIVDTSMGPIKKIIRSELTLKNLNKENKIESVSKVENKDEDKISEQRKPKLKVKKKLKNHVTQSETGEECKLKSAINSVEDNKKMYENMFNNSYLLNISAIEEEIPVKKKVQKRKEKNKACEDINLEKKAKKNCQAEDVKENPVINITKPKKTKKKIEKPKEEPASVQIMKFINDAFKISNEKINVSTSNNESKYGVLDIERIPPKKNDLSSSSSSDESEKKYPIPTFQMRDKSKEKELKPSTSLCSTTFLKKEVKDEKKKIKKIHFDE